MRTVGHCRSPKRNQCSFHLNRSGPAKVPICDLGATSSRQSQDSSPVPADSQARDLHCRGQLPPAGCPPPRGPCGELLGSDGDNLGLNRPARMPVYLLAPSVQRGSGGSAWNIETAEGLMPAGGWWCVGRRAFGQSRVWGGGDEP